MNRQLNDLQQILSYQLGLQNLSVQLEHKGNVLQILLLHITGDPIDAQWVDRVVKDALDASLYPSVRKVIVYTRRLRDDTAEPAPLLSFPYDSLPDEVDGARDVHILRRADFPAIQIGFFAVGILSLTLVKPAGALGLVPGAIALGCGFGFPWAKRWTLKWNKPVLNWALILTGSALCGLAIALAFPATPLALVMGAALLMVGALVLIIGWN